MGASSSSSAISSHFRIVTALNAEWRQLATECETEVRHWAAQWQPLSVCTRLDDVLAAIRRSPDEALLALLTEHAAGDVLAGRAVLQALLGKVVRMARRDRRAQVDDYIAALWFRIGTYPVSQRREKVAANLALDTLKSVTQESSWSRRGPQVTPLWSEELLDEIFTNAQLRADLDHNASLASLSAAEVIAAASRLGLIDVKARDVLLTVYADGLSGRDAADLHQTSTAMIRFRCSRAVRRLADNATSLAEAA